jgi:hypothetical protein
MTALKIAREALEIIARTVADVDVAGRANRMARDALAAIALTDAPQAAVPDTKISRSDLLKIANEAFHEIVDYDFAGNAITDYDVLLWGAYGPAVTRLVNLALKHLAATAPALPEHPKGYWKNEYDKLQLEVDHWKRLAESPPRVKLFPMGETNTEWYFNCAEIYIDVEKDAAGKLSIFVRDRLTGKEGWLDQSDAQPINLPAAKK